MESRVYYDTDFEQWVINDIEAVPPGKALLKIGANTGLVSIAIPGIDAPIDNVDPTTIYKDADKTETYSSAEDLRTTCKDLFIRAILSSNVRITDPTQQSPDYTSDKLDVVLSQIRAWLVLLQGQVDSLANATGLILFNDATTTTTEQTVTFTVSTPSTDTSLLDFDADNSLVNYVANAKFTVSSVLYATNTDGLDHVLTINVYAVSGGVETLLDTFEESVPKKSNDLLISKEYIETITDAPRDVRLKWFSTSDTKMSVSGFQMKISATNPE